MKQDEGKDPGFTTIATHDDKTSYELELSDDSIDGVPGQTIGDLFTATVVTGSSGGYGNLQSTQQ